MLKNPRVRIAVAVVAVLVFALVAALTIQQIQFATTTAQGTGVPSAPTLALPVKSSNTPAASLQNQRLIRNVVGQPVAERVELAQATTFFTSCTADRRITPTPTGAALVATAAATQAATAAATAAATQAATQAATAVAADPDFVVFAIAAKESEACYQVGEVFLNRGNQFALAVGVTTAISGEIAIDRNNTANSTLGQLVIDISQLASDSPNRDGAIRRQWLESNKFPLAKFTTKKITGLPVGKYTAGSALTFTVSGDLEVRGKTRPTDFKVTATLKDGVLYGSGFADVKMSDWGFDAPNIAGTLKANDEARLIFNFVAREKK
jgi:polyisoprenoid-binding protein YceI